MALGNRQIVRHEGNDSGQGRWSCSKHKEAACGHISVAQDFLQQLLQIDPEARHSSDTSSRYAMPGKWNYMCHGRHPD